MEKPASHLKEHIKSHLEDLNELVRIPSVSFDGFPPEEVKKSAEAVARLLKKRGLEQVQILELSGAHPYVYGEKIQSPELPTLLLYAHHDVQPPGRMEKWKTSPFEPTVLDGPGGKRLFGRGTADDKAGIVIHTAAISSYLDSVGKLPVNVKVLIEGEEEIGSLHLAEFITQHRKLLGADILVLTDTSNFDCGIPALTVALRGLVAFEIEVRALSKTVHSGVWGGPIPDPVMALSKMLSLLVDEEGRILVPGIMEQIRPLTDSEQKTFAQIPYHEKEFRAQAGLVPHGKILTQGAQGMSPLVQLFRFPSLIVNAIQASSRQQAGNVINDAAWAKVGIRLVPDLDPKKVLQQIQDFLKAHVPWGLEVTFKSEEGTGAWSIEPVGPAFEAADAALSKGYGKPVIKLGSGGSIPFVKPFAEALGGAPALLIGVEDPYTNAHGENESLLISDFEKACLSQIYLFEEIAQRFTRR